MIIFILNILYRLNNELFLQELNTDMRTPMTFVRHGRQGFYFRCTGILFSMYRDFLRKVIGV